MKHQILRHIAFRSRWCVFVVVVVGGGILTEDTIWASSKGKRCQAAFSVFPVIKDTLNVVKY